MDLDQCATRVLECSRASCQAVEARDPLRREIISWIGRVDPATGACDRSGAVGVIEDLINEMQPTENGISVVYLLDRNVGKGGRGNTVRCQVMVTCPNGGKIATVMTTQQVILGHPTYRWRGLLPLWRGTTKEHNVTITKWALLSRHQGVCRAMWNAQEPKSVAEFAKALQKIRIASRHREPATAVLRVESHLQNLLTRYGGGSRKRSETTDLAPPPPAKRVRPEVPTEVLQICPLARTAYRDALSEVSKQEAHLGGAGDDFIEALVSAAAEALRGIRSERCKQVAVMLRDARRTEIEVPRADVTATTDCLIFRTSRLQATIARRHQLLVGLLESSKYKELRAILEVGVWGSFDGSDLRRALLRDRTSTVGLRSAWEGLMPLVNNHQDPIIIWEHGKPVVNKAAVGYKHLVEHFGPAVCKLVIQKRLELERHNPSGMYPLAYLRRPGTTTALKPSDALAMIAAVIAK
jgi:hypothetical protein